MTFFVRKRLALGPIRFGVAPRQTVEAIDGDPALSTGPGGEFVHRSGEKGFFFGDTTRFDAPALPVAKSISSTPFWTSMKAHLGFVALMTAGIVFVLLGFAVIGRKGPQGWVEVILGLGMIGTPIVLTARERKELREKEERERADREAVEKRNRELLAAYTSALDRVRRERTPDAIAALAREREALTLPDEIWVPAARRTVLLIGFEELSKGSTNVVDDVARAAGLTDADLAAIKADIYRTVLWHLLADDRAGAAQEARLRELASELGYGGDDGAAEQFRRLRGITAKNLPQVESPVTLGFQERAIHAAGPLVITNKRLIVRNRKQIDVPLPQLNDIDVDADEETLT
ncbi:MAG TPA: hypothetical protein VG323_04705, partial [Thermoanaerobaculia bacterium]|nr:hypothetical protein [Thermoanaerobaculia bacterium]